MKQKCTKEAEMGQYLTIFMIVLRLLWQTSKSCSHWNSFIHYSEPIELTNEVNIEPD